MGRKINVVHPNRKEMAEKGEMAYMTVYALPGTGGHHFIINEIKERINEIKTRVCLFGDKRTLEFLYGNFGKEKTVEFYDIAKLKTTAVEEEGKTTWAYIDFYNVPETEHLKEALNAFMTNVKERKDIVVTCICNRVSEVTTEFTKGAAFIRCHGLDLDSINRLTETILPPIPPESIRYHIRKYYFIKTLTGNTNTYLLGTRMENGSFTFKKRTLHL